MRHNEVGWFLQYLNPEKQFTSGMLQASIVAYENCQQLGNRLSRREQRRLVLEGERRGRGRPPKRKEHHF